MIRFRSFFTIVLIIMFLSIKISYAQPYKYCFYGEWRNRSIFRINLETGISEELLSDCGIGLQVFVTTDQSRIVYTDRTMVYAFDINDLDNKFGLMEKTRDEEIIEILDAPKTNKIYLMFGDVDHVPKMTIVFDRVTFAPVDTLYGIYSYWLPFLSVDETKIFRLVPDKKGIYFKILNTNDNVINEKKRCGSLGSFNFITGIRDRKNGKALIIFSYQKGHEHKYYVVCNPEQGINYEPIHFPWRSEAYLSPDAENVILEEAQFIDDDDPNTPVTYRPGNFYIFDAQTGKLKKRLKLPPEGEILLFDTHPSQMFYYQPEAPQEPISVDVTQEQPDTDLIDMLISDVNTAYEKGWIDNQGIANSLDKKLENAKKQLEKGKTNTAVNILNAFVNEVEAQKDKHLTSEAYTLLKYNAEYLLTKLKEQ